ncbi:MAG: Fe-S-containing protein, partial [Thermodesulfovibrionales bacterium]|nr:Fe-S-containing protein [Thermodesulfovibrionales bacterium]
EKKGYRQEGDIMVCNNCGQAFPSTQINVIKGGCNPAPIERHVEGDYLIMRASDIEVGRMYF